MAAYEYVALDQRGKQRKGVLEGDTAKSVRGKLREQSLTPLSVDPVAAGAAARAGGGAKKLPRRRSLSGPELAMVTRQLATLSQAGLPLEEALQAIADQSDQARTRSVVMGVRARVREGYSLAGSMLEFPAAFPAMFRATVDAGEQSGKLDNVLERLADYTENRQNLASKARAALVYPALLILMSIAVVVLMLIYVVPKIVSVFASTGAELPLLTRILIASSEFLQSWWWLLLVAIAGLIAGVRWLLARPGPKRRWDAIKLAMPMIGRLNRGLNTARFMRTLAILAASGVPVLESLKIAGEVIENVPMRDAVADASVRIREGAPISQSLGEPGVFPPMTIHLISSGEASGRLDEMLERAASNQERETDNLISSLMSIVEPLIIVFMGIVVLLIVLAILMPIFNMNALIG